MTSFLEVRNVRKAFQGREVLRGVSLSLEAGERVALMGPSGSGKSTLLHCIGGVESLDSGEVWLEGQRLDQLDETGFSRLRLRKVSSVSQFFHLLPTLTVLENVAFPLRLAGSSSQKASEQAESLLNEVSLSHRIMAYPDQLSGGEMQRVAIARALVIQPRLILADEPTGNLDTKTGAEVLSLIGNLCDAHSTTLLMVTHSEMAAACCHRIIRFQDGKLEEPLTANEGS